LILLACALLGAAIAAVIATVVVARKPLQLSFDIFSFLFRYEHSRNEN